MEKIPHVLLLVESSRAYGRGLLRGIARYANLHGPWAFYREPGGQERPLPQINHWNVDGVIARFSGTRKERQIIAKRLPFIAIAFKNQISGLPNIIADNIAIGRMAAEHLLNCGLRHFAFCGFTRMDWALERRASFRKTIAEAGFSSRFYDRPRSKFKLSWENEYALMATWLKSLSTPVGIMSCNDDHGRHVLEACKIGGLQVPEQVAIIGVDDDDLVCELSDPPLSSIALNTERAGYEAAELLHKLMSGERRNGQNILVRPTHVVMRQSTNIFTIEDAEIVEALRFIRQHSKEMIRVDDVAEAVAMSRRSLEKRFRTTLKSSVLEEIRRVRVDQVCRMLVTTNMSVSKIASTLGYSSAGNLNRYFWKEKQMTPLAYRKQYGHK